MVVVQSRRRAVPVELDLDLRLIRSHHLAADRASDTTAAAAVPAIRRSRGQAAVADGRAGFIGKSRLVRHGSPLVWLLAVLRVPEDRRTEPVRSGPIVNTDRADMPKRRVR